MAAPHRNGWLRVLLVMSDELFMVSPDVGRTEASRILPEGGLDASSSCCSGGPPWTPTLPVPRHLTPEKSSDKTQDSVQSEGLHCTCSSRRESGFLHHACPTRFSAEKSLFNRNQILNDDLSKQFSYVGVYWNLPLATPMCGQATKRITGYCGQTKNKNYNWMH